MKHFKKILVLVITLSAQTLSTIPETNTKTAPKPKYIVFDLSGVLIETGYFKSTTWHTAKMAAGKAFSSVVRFNFKNAYQQLSSTNEEISTLLDYQKKGHKTLEEIWQNWTKGNATLDQTIDKALAETRKILGKDELVSVTKADVREFFMQPSTPIKETIKIAQELKDQDYELYLLSNIAQEEFEWLKKNEACKIILKLFEDEDMVLSYRERFMKPHPQIFKAFLDKLPEDTKPQDCIFIDDQQKNIDASKEFGMQTIHYQSPSQLKTELKVLGIYKQH